MWRSSPRRRGARSAWATSSATRCHRADSISIVSSRATGTASWPRGTRSRSPRSLSGCSSWAQWSPSSVTAGSGASIRGRPNGGTGRSPPSLPLCRGPSRSPTDSGAPGARRADGTLPPDVVSLESSVRILYSLALVEAHGLVVHAASLIRDGGAYLFCGPSGSGKTTVARLSPDPTLLSDELSIVRTTGGPAVCFGTPFRGELALAGADRAARLVGIYFLRHGDRHAVL